MASIVAGMAKSGSDDDVLAGVGPRLRALRQERGATLTGLSAATGISVSTLSRLESGQRRPTLELLLPLAQAYRVPLDDGRRDGRASADPGVGPGQDVTGTARAGRGTRDRPARERGALGIAVSVSDARYAFGSCVVAPAGSQAQKGPRSSRI